MKNLIINVLVGVVEVEVMGKKGKWIEKEYYVGNFNSETTGDIEITMVHGKCTECKSYSYNICQLYPVMYPYCPKCGAEMKGWDK